MLPSIIHLTGRAGRSAMGVSSVIWGLSQAQLSRGEHVTIWCCDETAALESAREYGISPDVVVPFPIIGPQRFCFSPQMRRAAKASRGDMRVLHQHGIWTAVSEVTNIWRGRGMPTMLAPHGSLDSWALRKSPMRKALALRMFESENLSRASCLHATSVAEMEDMRRFGLNGAVALIPNGVSRDWLTSTGTAQRFREKFGIAEEKRIAFFLSRITPKKGLPLLLEAWGRKRRGLEDWCLVIAGSDEFSHLGSLVAQVEAASLGQSVCFLGPLYGRDKRDAFAAADVFVLPSHGEGSPMAVLDALGAGVPVLTTQRTPWEDLVRHCCGWWVPDHVGAIEDALIEISLHSREDLQAWGSRGKALVSEDYSWESAADKCHQVYSWLLGLAERPRCVHAD